MKTEALEDLVNRFASRTTNKDDLRLLGKAAQELTQIISQGTPPMAATVTRIQAPPPARVSLRKMVTGECRRRAQETLRQLMGDG